MRRTSVISLIMYILLTSVFFKVSAQEIKKEVVYLLFNKNTGKHHYNKGKKFSNNKGLNFNLYTHYFIHKKQHKRDTICLKNLREYKITEEKGLKKKEQIWKRKNEKLLKKRHILYKQLNKNNIFQVFIIEVISNDKMVLYEAVFRNEGVIK